MCSQYQCISIIVFYIRHTNCSSCLSHHNECAWCEETLECFAFNIYMLRYMYGTCTHWVDRLGRQNCHDCSQHTTCATCLTEYQCGWCSETNDPLQGTCMHGDYAGMRQEVRGGGNGSESGIS